jgi:hypothetical protein
MRKELIGWLWVSYEDTALYETKETMDWGNPYSVEKLHEQIESFHGRKVKIIIEEVEN